MSSHIDLTDAMVKEEEQFWSEQFRQELNNNSDNELFSSVWWRNYYYEIADYFRKELPLTHDKTVLEPGCGSGKSSILLGRSIERTLLDISDEALKYAHLIAAKFHAENITYVKGNLFQLPFEDKEFDLVWNIGVVEHYDLDGIQRMLEEMIRVTKQGGLCAIGMPNRFSGPIIKASLLRWRLFKSVPGYRLGSEKFYTTKDIRSCFEKALTTTGRTSVSSHTMTFGNPLPMETPEWILTSIGALLNKRLPRNRFLSFYIYRIL